MFLFAQHDAMNGIFKTSVCRSSLNK